MNAKEQKKMTLGGKPLIEEEVSSLAGEESEEVKALMEKCFSEVREKGKYLPQHCLENSDPVKCSKILFALAQGESKKSIRARYNSDYAAINRIHKTHSVSIEPMLQHFAVKSAIITGCILETIERKIELLDDDGALAQESLSNLTKAASIMVHATAALKGKMTPDENDKEGATMAEAQRKIDEAAERVAKKSNGRVIIAEEVEQED